MRTGTESGETSCKSFYGMLSFPGFFPRSGQWATTPLPFLPLQQTLWVLLHLSVFLKHRYKYFGLCWFWLNDKKGIMLYIIFGDIVFVPNCNAKIHLFLWPASGYSFWLRCTIPLNEWATIYSDEYSGCLQVFTITNRTLINILYKTYSMQICFSFL